MCSRWLKTNLRPAGTPRCTGSGRTAGSHARKLIAGGGRGLGRAKLGEFHLANLSDAEPEVKNHADANPDIVKRLRRLHEEWVARVTPDDLPSTIESLP